MVRNRARADENGVTLVELLVAISITGVVSVGILAGLLTLSTSADRAQKSSDAGSVLYTAADALQTLAYDASCTETYSLTAPTGFPATPPGMRVTSANVTVTKVEYWDAATAKFTNTCVPSLAVGDPRRLQRVTLRAVLGDGRVDRSLEVVKRG